MFWALGVATAMFLVWLSFHFVGEQRYYNTPFWQRWRPIVLTSEAQTAVPVEVRDEWRNALTVVQTEKGLYFLSGTKHVPSAGTQVVVEANDHWELYMCSVGAAPRCMTIHSFCADAVWPNVKRDATGHAEGCYAPYFGSRSTAEVGKPSAPEPPRGGPGKRFTPVPPAVGVSHPREWAALMGLPVPAAGGAAR